MVESRLFGEQRLFYGRYTPGSETYAGNVILLYFELKSTGGGSEKGQNFPVKKAGLHPGIPINMAANEAIIEGVVFFFIKILNKGLLHQYLGVIVR